MDDPFPGKALTNSSWSHQVAIVAPVGPILPTSSVGFRLF
jgi:hypothetical protein